MSKTRLKQLATRLDSKMGNALKGWQIVHEQLSVDVHLDQILSVLSFLRDDTKCRFTTLVDICGVDYPGRSSRFDVVYHFLSMTQNIRIRLKVAVDEDEVVPSAIPVFPAANWYEREAFDMYGIVFDGHPDLRRLLTDYGFSGHPLRKDFPLSGHVECRYDEEQKRVIYEPVSLPQEFRQFDNLSPWEGANYVREEEAKGEAEDG
ncbi:MAG: NADH-quinone oxidoreductase subunit C [Robiginitomaculum sp.]|nr:MAG: NADH-quinone oxidoreductase subunit C [Robiginitomaculum sp.]